MKKVFLIIASFAFCVSHAGIRVIHGGGGYAEMVSLSLLSRLESLIVPCVTLPERCGLRTHQTEILRHALHAGIFKTQMARLEFSTDLVSPATDENRMTLKQSEVYTSEGKPRSVPEIALALYSHWLRRPSIEHWFRAHGVDVAEVTALGSQLFPHVSVYEESLEWNKSVLHALNFRLADGEARVLISVEEAAGATNVTPVIEEQIACAEQHSTKLLGLRRLHIEGGIALGHLQWMCRGEIFTGLVAMAKNRDDSEIRVNILNRELVNCEHELKAGK